MSTPDTPMTPTPANNPQAAATDAPTRAGHEPDVQAAGLIWLIAGSVALLVVLCYLGAMLLSWGWQWTEPPTKHVTPARPMVRPGKGPWSVELLRDVRGKLEAEQQANLHASQWTDRNQGFAKIPIDDAMKLIEQHGLPDFGPVTHPPQPSANHPNDTMPRPVKPQEVPQR